jgi:7,8-dihydropterin-6-yl-methyl-4-(beta-D-ribofuranosyl)aminobenzene 5'-phosphate synthase
MKVTFLMDNEPKNAGFLCEHGFSCWIETETHGGDPLSILFDTAHSDRFLTNAARLGIDVKSNRYTVISHGHYDHGGGLSALFEQAPYSRVFLSEKAFDPLMKGDVGEKYFYAEKSIGLNTGLLKSQKDNLVPIGKKTELEDNIYLETDLEEPNKRPENSRLCRIDNEKTMIPDDFRHEIYLTVREQESLFIFTGCAHRGAANIMAMAQKNYPGGEGGIKKYYLIGGFHLSQEKDNRQVELIKNFIQKSPASWHLVTGHCTGMKAYEELKDQLDCPVDYGYGGSFFVFNQDR